MAPHDELIDAVCRERIAASRNCKMTFAERFMAGAALFDYACEIARSSIKLQNPDWTDEQILNEIRRRIDIAERVRETLDLSH